MESGHTAGPMSYISTMGLHSAGTSKACGTMVPAIYCCWGTFDTAVLCGDY
jgi:hypothetical protein